MERCWQTKTALPWALTFGLAITALATGCRQVQVGGQTLPSPFYTEDDVQYFPPYNEFKLAREAAALEAARDDEALSTP